MDAPIAGPVSTSSSLSLSSNNFNNQGNILIASSETKYTIFRLSPKIEKYSNTNMDRIIKTIKMLDNTNMMIVLYANLISGVNNSMSIWDDKMKTSIVEINLKDNVRDVFIVRNCTIAVLERIVCVFNYKGALIGSKNTYCNENGICCASDNLIATLGETKGSILLWNHNAQSSSTINAHSNNISAIEFNNDETLIATASEMGTNIHVFEIDSGDLKYKLRRGLSKAKIMSMTFSFDGEMLACSSSTKTVHVFKLKDNLVSDKVAIPIMAIKIPDYFNTSNMMNWSFTQFQIDEDSHTKVKFGRDGSLNAVTACGSYYRTSHKTNYMNINKKMLNFD